jgi:hypothetical protein
MTEPKKPPPFTADNLPEAARAFFDDEKGAGERAARKIVRDLDDHAAKVINSLCAAHPGLREWLLSDTAPVATDQPPEVDTRLLSEAHRLIGDMSLQGDALKRGLDGFLQLVWQTHRPAPADSVRFALGKVTDEQLKQANRRATLAAARRPADTPLNEAISYTTEDFLKHFRAELAKILPVAEPVKQWAELTDDDAFQIVRKSYQAWRDAGTDTCVSVAAASLRASLSAYATPPSRVEVTPEVMEAFTEAWCALNEQNGQTFTDEPGYENLSRPIMTAHLSSFRAALAVANTQANARESEAVAGVERWREVSIANRDAFAAMRNALNEHIPIQSDEADLLAGPEFIVSCEAVARAVIAEVARLKGDMEQAEAQLDHANVELGLIVSERDGLKGEIERLTEERDLARNTGGEAFKALVALRTHAAALEALLTVDGVDGQKVKLWLPFERRSKIPSRDSPWVLGGINFAANAAAEYRQTPAPEAEEKRWRVKYLWGDVEELITKPLTRADAEKIGEVIGPVD